MLVATVEPSELQGPPGIVVYYGPSHGLKSSSRGVR